MDEELEAALMRAGQQIEHLQQQCEALRKDAERYRWLRDRLLAADFDWNNTGESVLVFEWPADASIGADLDAAIDAARQRVTTNG